MKSNGAPGPKVRLGELLVKAGVITDAQLRSALSEQKQWGGKLGDILVRMQVLSEDVFVRALSKQLALPRADLGQEIPLEALAKVPAEIAEEYEIVPLALLDDGRTLAVATADPLNLTALDTVRQISGLRVQSQVAGASAVRAAIARLYQGDRDAPQSLEFVNNANDRPGGSPRGEQRTPHLPSGPPGPPPIPQYATPAHGIPAYPTAMRPPPNAYGVPSYGLPGPAPMSAPPYPAMPTYAPPPQRPPEDPRFSTLEEAQRREIVALRALVELLVQKGVISLDEYLARLKR